mgnify:CR=1 FL=1
MLRLRNFALVMGVVALTIYAMVVGRAILLPLVVAIVVWYLINVLAKSFHRSVFIPLPRLLCLPAAVVVFLALAAIILLLRVAFSGAQKLNTWSSFLLSLVS